MATTQEPEKASVDGEAKESADSSAEDEDAAQANGDAPGGSGEGSPKPSGKKGAARQGRGQRLTNRKEAKARQKQDKQQTAPMEVEVAARDLSEWMTDNQRPILTVLGVGLAISVLVLVLSGQRASSAASAATLLQTAVDVALAPLDSPDSLTPDSASNAPGYDSPGERASQALEAYDTLEKVDGDSAVAVWGALGRAGSLLQLGKWEQALTAYQAVVASPVSASPSGVELTVRALEGQGFSLEGSGKLDAAMEKFDALRGVSEGAYGDLADYHVARMQIALGKSAEAQVLLEQVHDRLQAMEGPEPVYLAGEVEQRLLDLGSDKVKPRARPSGGAQPDFSNPQIQQLLQQLKLGKGGAPGLPPGMQLTMPPVPSGGAPSGGAQP